MGTFAAEVQIHEKIRRRYRAELGIAGDSDDEFDSSPPSPLPDVETEAFFASLTRDGELRLALATAPALRTREEVLRIMLAIRRLREDFFGNLSDAMLRSVCAKLVLEQYNEGQVIFDYGDYGDKLYLIMSGSILISKPHVGHAPSHGTTGESADVILEPVAYLGPGKVFGELAIIGNCRRAARTSASKLTQVLVLGAEDYHSCIGRVQEDFLAERVAFLRSVDKAVLEGSGESDLAAMAAHMRQERYSGEEVVVAQGAEADKIFFVKSGFCRVLRQLHPRYHGHLKNVAAKCLPPANPFTTPVKTNEVIVSPEDGEARRIHDSLGGPAALQRLLERHHAVGTPVSPSSPSKQKRSPRPQPRPFSKPAAELAMTEGVVPAATLQPGQSFGFMELFEGTPYQCTLLADPCVEVYTISKYDLIRSTSRAILHKLFVDCTGGLSDDRIIGQMKFQSRWNSFKADLLDEIRSKRRPAATLDRGVTAHRAGAPNFSANDYARIWNIEGSEGLVQPMPRSARQHGSHAPTEPIFHVHCVREPGKPTEVVIEEENNDSSIQALHHSILNTVAQSRARKQLSPIQRGDASPTGSPTASKPSPRLRPPAAPRDINNTRKLAPPPSLATPGSKDLH